MGSDTKLRPRNDSLMLGCRRELYSNCHSNRTIMRCQAVRAFIRNIHDFSTANHSNTQYGFLYQAGPGRLSDTFLFNRNAKIGKIILMCLYVYRQHPDNLQLRRVGVTQTAQTHSDWNNQETNTIFWQTRGCFTFQAIPDNTDDIFRVLLQIFDGI